MSFTGKTCVVTGGANGIGRCIVEKFAAAGANVAFIDVDAAAGRKLAKAIGSQAYFMKGDIAKERVLSRFSNRVLDRFDTVDCIINNAAISRRGIFSGCSYDDFLYVQQVGVVAPYMLASLFLGAYGKGASIVNISSTRAFISQPDTESYTAAKGGISALTHALAISLSGQVRVNAISPGWIDSSAYYQEGKAGASQHAEADRQQHPAGRVGTPEDIAALALFLCGPDASFITGQNIIVDGGMTRQMIYHDDHGWSFDPNPGF
ncbi:SDR family oxidoreductase [Oxalobacter vibrioformis]|uniref:SDR family oxidoreductase n=1 Tax=Oxalobacter vibrioformis TaxID=933080 RepID=A0A9E9LYV6_9BURK|nr:SDR family oxidoreductase [Oxalobacter vibrioformis]WAW10087.1 SDR family oxidoreductase [Oxalobacter vibrioformis]